MSTQDRIISETFQNFPGHTRRLSAALALAQFAAFVALPVPVAQGQQAGVLEEVLVTARRREESQQEVPIAITALNDQYLREKNIVALEDIRTHVPSLGVGVGGSSTNTPIISLRGQRPSEVLITLDPAVPLYFADVVLTPTQGTNLSMYDLSSVQVLKGPQGTLFGRNSTGGAVLFTPRGPGDELGGYVEARGGDYGMAGLEGAIDVPLGDKAAVRFAGRALKRDGYQDNLAANDLNGDEQAWDEDSKAVRVSLRLSPSDSFENISIFDWNKNEMVARVPTPLAFSPSNATGCQICPVANSFFNSGANAGLIDDALERQRGRDWNEIETDLDGREEVENTFFANTTTWDINDRLTLKNIFGYRDLESSAHNDTDGTWLPMFGSQTEGTQSSIGVTTPSSAPAGSVETEQYSNELQLLGVSADENLDWIVGLYYFDMDGSQTSPTQILPIVPQDSPNGEAQNKAYAVFGEATYALNDQWALTLGARQSWDEREVVVSNTRRGACLVQDPDNPGTTLPSDQCARSEDEDFSASTWRVMATWTPRDSHMAYGSVSSGYRTGGFNMRGVNDLELLPFDEETVINYEIGYKADWSFGNGALLRSNFALYYQDYQDIQKTQASTGADGTFGTSTINAAEASIGGFEADIWLTPVAGLDLGLAYSYVDAEYQDWDILDPATGGFIDASDREFTWIPENSLTATARWELPLSESLGVVSLGVNYYYQDEVRVVDQTDEYTFPGIDNGPLNDTISQDSYSVWDARADWHNIMQSNFDLALWVKNAGDKEYAVGGLNVLDSLGWAANVYGAPRTYGASLRFSF